MAAFGASGERAPGVDLHTVEWADERHHGSRAGAGVAVDANDLLAGADEVVRARQADVAPTADRWCDRPFG